MGCFRRISSEHKQAGIKGRSLRSITCVLSPEEKYGKSPEVLIHFLAYYNPIQGSSFQMPSGYLEESPKGCSDMIQIPNDESVWGQG